MTVPIKVISLVILTLSTSVTVLMMRYSRSTTKYLSSSAVFMAEIGKIMLSIICLYLEVGCSIESLKNIIMESVIRNVKETVKVSIPAAVYTLQNNLLYVALTNLDAATYQVTYQLKILTTAVFSVVMFRRSLSRQQWFALLLLMIGAALVQLPSNKTVENDDNNTIEDNVPSRLVGFLAVLTCSFSSGFAGVYFEKLLKVGNAQTTSLSVRNLQLCIFGAVFSAGAMLYSDYPAIASEGLFQGYDAVAWIVVFLQMCGGFVISLTMKYADNILKGFATSISIIISTLASYYLLGDIAPSLPFMFGACIVIGATFLYGLPSAAAAAAIYKPKKIFDGK